MSDDPLSKLAEELDRRADQFAQAANCAGGQLEATIADVRADTYAESADVAREMAEDSGGDEA